MWPVNSSSLVVAQGFDLWTHRASYYFMSSQVEPLSHNQSDLWDKSAKNIMR